jgi:hypothetical protein
MTARRRPLDVARFRSTDVASQAMLPAERHHERLVGIGGAGTQAVIEMGDYDPALSWRAALLAQAAKCRHCPSQGDAVRPPRNRQKHRYLAPLRYWPRLGKSLLEGVVAGGQFGVFQHRAGQSKNMVAVRYGSA